MQVTHRLAGRFMVRALHRVRLAAASLTIREDATVVTAHKRLGEGHSDHVEHLPQCGARAHAR